MTHPTYEQIRRVTDQAQVILARNPGPMTLDGTNSYVLSAPGATEVVVVDPGPDDAEHLRALSAVAPVALILITHWHADHTAGAAAFGALTGAPVRAVDPAYCHGGSPLVDGETIHAADVRIDVVTTPGHTGDSVCFLLPDDRHRSGAVGSVLTGDTILGRGTTVIAHPDGRLGPYLDSLDKLAKLGSRYVLPAHGAELPDLQGICAAYLQHRSQRLAAVRTVVDRLGSAATVASVTDAVYGDVDSTVRFAAELSVRAQLEYLNG